LFAGQQRELGVELDPLHGAVADLDAVAVQKVDEAQLYLQQADLHPDAVVRPGPKGQVGHGRLQHLVRGTEAFRVEALRIWPVLQKDNNFETLIYWYT